MEGFIHMLIPKLILSALAHQARVVSTQFNVAVPQIIMTGRKSMPNFQRRIEQVAFFHVMNGNLPDRIL